MGCGIKQQITMKSCQKAKTEPFGMRMKNHVRRENMRKVVDMHARKMNILINCCLDNNKQQYNERVGGRISLHAHYALKSQSSSCERVNNFNIIKRHNLINLRHPKKEHTQCMLAHTHTYACTQREFIIREERMKKFIARESDDLLCHACDAHLLSRAHGNHCVCVYLHDYVNLCLSASRSLPKKKLSNNIVRLAIYEKLCQMLAQICRVCKKRNSGQ
jgi:hypothetical protein